MAGFIVTYTLGLCSLLLLVTCSVSDDCPDVIIKSEDGKIGNFSSPSYPQNYADGLKCLIKFVGNADERVQINFTDFKLDGFPNELVGVHTGCVNDYIDIYTEIEHPDHDILELPHQGRYCGNDLSKLPHLLMSLNRTLIITFDSDRDGRTDRGFFGNYEFISSEPYRMGTPASLGSCGWTMYAETKSEGDIMAPYYPAVYPDNLNCFYKLEGIPGQRIKLEFTDFDLYYGGNHCPYDNLKIYDGSSVSDPEIGVYCNRIEGLVIYSTSHQLFMKFETRSGRPPVEYHWGDNIIRMSGFKARYTFSNAFVDLAFIRYGSHIRGSECDLRIKSSKTESSGEIISPNFPRTSPPNITCYYYIDGLIDRENLEKVVLTFNTAQLPTSPTSSRCGMGQAYISTYLHGQTATTANPDGYICDSNLPSSLVSKDPRLTLKYTTRNVTPSSAVGFKANYQFTIDYAIEGTPASIIADSECHFMYRSSSVKQGKLNSPRYPSSYPNDITCTYELIAQPHEFIMISFDTFNVDSTSDQFHDCQGDSISAKSVIPQAENKTLHIPMGEYCGTAYPGPLVSEWLTERMVLTFKSDSAVAKRGFLAKYEFINSPQRFPCGGNITEGGSGIIVPPNYPLKYKTRTVCDWYIYHSNPLAQIKIKFDHFDIEGTMEEGCQGAVLRIYKSDEHTIDYETCGQEAPVDNVISDNGFIRIKFISSSKSFGKTGFKITWSEVMLGATKLSNMHILYIIMGAVIVVLILVLITICACIRCTVKKTVSRRNSTRRTSSKPSEVDVPIDPEMICSDTKTPMLPTSHSTNSTFMPYDHQTSPKYNGHSSMYPPVGFEQPTSTLSSKYSYNSPLHSSIHQASGPSKYYSHQQNQYDMDSCLTSL